MAVHVTAAPVWYACPMYWPTMEQAVTAGELMNSVYPLVAAMPFSIAPIANAPLACTAQTPQV